MPRKARIVEPGTPMHITQRGNRGENIFRSDDDKAFYIKTFMFYKTKFKVKIYAWALMDNHIHFILEPKNKNSIGKLFHSLNTKYVMYFNRKYKLDGRLFSSRCYSCLLDDPHLYEAIRYVELNPYRANKETKLASYPWTSARERLGRIKTKFLSSIRHLFTINNWLAYLMEVVVNKSNETQQSWENLKKHTQRNMPLGGKVFIKKLQEKFKQTIHLKFRNSYAERNALFVTNGHEKSNHSDL